jgi:dihydroxyacetone kinase-like protein
MTTPMDANTVAFWLISAEHEIRVQADHLSRLDAALGDGDHGTNMSRGFAAVATVVAEQQDAATPGELLILAGKTLLSTIGGASGALWGFGLRRAGRALDDADSFDGPALADALDAMVDAVVELGEAAPGDKTMLDALMPAAATLRRELAAGQPLHRATSAAAAAARAGADATEHMEARVGRASFIGERSVGHQDPSANSAAIVLAALARATEPYRASVHDCAPTSS